MNKFLLIGLGILLLAGCSDNNKRIKPKVIVNYAYPDGNSGNTTYVYPDGNAGSERDYYQNTKKSKEVFYLRKQNPMFQKGFYAGCNTGKGSYSKNRNLFNNDFEYNKGWFFGVSQCRR